MAEGKLCTKCGATKPLNAFQKWARGKDGLQVHCRDCRRETQRAYRERNVEKTRAWARERKRRLAKMPGHKEEMKAKRIKHRGHISEYNARYYRENIERERARRAKWSAENPDRYREPGSSARYSRQRRARVRDLPTVPYMFDEILLRDEGRCGICNQPIMGIVEIDHIVPISRGGADTPENVRLTHRACNRRKHARLDDELVA